ncbi:3-oxoacyl-[acyl-carrier-protein] reductase [Massiliimalia massiliensis]|uniref:3-oxoacyl-[acyl-carrier-protein] reductase n=1 Tax=Massiliimalia massiliensis TaxID=1852384 RepID=UPI000986EF7A|nr:3-oxoacyl-[acyl-carrier-protein] reductase [Massiliimalia massiliensis]
MSERKTALITGASQGLGAAMALRLAKDGFNIAINCRGEVEIENGGRQVKAECEALGVKAECFIADVSSFEACKEMVAAVKEHFGTIDVLINNAGITKDGLLVRMSEAQFDMVTNVNYKSVFNMTRHVGAVMMKQRSGRIINVSSVAGLYGNPGQFNYSASKAGIVGMTLTTAKELGPRGITANAIAPGFIETPMTDVLDEKVKARCMEAVALRRFGKPEEVASVVSFLASDDASYVSGQVIVIDGAMQM